MQNLLYNGHRDCDSLNSWHSLQKKGEMTLWPAGLSSSGVEYWWSSEQVRLQTTSSPFWPDWSYLKELHHCVYVGCTSYHPWHTFHWLPWGRGEFNRWLRGRWHDFAQAPWSRDPNFLTSTIKKAAKLCSIYWLFGRHWSQHVSVWHFAKDLYHHISSDCI